MNTTVIWAVVVLGALGIVFGLILAFASKVFAVEKDAREEAIGEILPGANCGACGYPGCSGFAAAVAKGVAPANACSVGGPDLATQIGEIMGVEVVTGPKIVAQVLCSGHGGEKLRYAYEGLTDCRAMSRVSAGHMMCTYGCLGGGTCEEICQFNAIHVIDGVAVVDQKACVACNQCVDVCPRNIIQMIPLKTKRHVAVNCASQAKGAEVRKSCEDGCIGCGLCVKACPKEGAITMENNLAKINYEICIGCGICAQKCPRKTITVDGKVPEPKPERPKPAPKADAASKADATAKDGEAPKAATAALKSDTPAAEVKQEKAETLETPGEKAERVREAGTATQAPDGERAAPPEKDNDTPAEMAQESAERPAQKEITDPGNDAPGEAPKAE